MQGIKCIESMGVSGQMCPCELNSFKRQNYSTINNLRNDTIHIFCSEVIYLDFSLFSPHITSHILSTFFTDILSL